MPFLQSKQYLCLQCCLTCAWHLDPGILILSRSHITWNLKALGVTYEADPLMKEFNDKISFKEGRYEVSLLWRDMDPPFLTNY